MTLITTAGARARLGAGALCLALAACAERPAEPAAAPAPQGWHTFEGSWTAAGEARLLEAGAGRHASIVDLSGAMLLTGERGLGVGFSVRAIAYSDGTATSVGRAVWTDERGDRIFSELRGAPVATGSRIRGTITGGSGRWTGITGEYEFDWKYVLASGEGRLTGRAERLRGRARLAASPEATP